MAAADYVWPRRSSLTRSPDTLSPVYPDRPIRPLPKNRLRSKLSPEQQGQIVYPPDPPTSSPLFSFPYGVVEKMDPRAVPSQHEPSHVSHCTCGGEHQDESDDDELVYDHPSYRWSSPVNDGSASRVDSVQRKLTAAKAPPAPASTASSADGYESFENTSNKKKRKIPLSGGGSVHQSSLSQELANMGISAREDEHGEQQKHFSGSGRGRYGRQHNAYASSLSAKSRGGNWKGDGTRTSETRSRVLQQQKTPTQNVLTETRTEQPNEHGIISQAIASAHHQQQQEPSTPTKTTGDKDSVSLLARSPSQTPTPQTQFTFTCESDSSNKMVWPGQGTPTPHSIPRASPSSQQTPVRPPQSHPNAQPPPPAATNAAPQNAPPKKTRPRRPSKEFAMAERQRRLQQEYTNYHQRPTKDSMWICEFCEYEDIWGSRPEALIRQYEIKDRKERQKAEERRRLLEKAKMKGRKGKKNNQKGQQKAQPTQANGQQYPQHPDDAPLPPDPQHDDLYDDDYDDAYDPVHHHHEDTREGAYPDDYAYAPEPRAPDKDPDPPQN